jgi:hypothetical protein
MVPSRIFNSASDATEAAIRIEAGQVVARAEGFGARPPPHPVGPRYRR